MYWCALSGRLGYIYDKNFEEEKDCNVFHETWRKNPKFLTSKS